MAARGGRRRLLLVVLFWLRVAPTGGFLLWLLGFEDEATDVLAVKTAEDFDGAVRFGGRNAFVKFYAPW